MNEQYRRWIAGLAGESLEGLEQIGLPKRGIGRKDPRPGDIIEVRRHLVRDRDQGWNGSGTGEVVNEFVRKYGIKVWGEVLSLWG